METYKIQVEYTDTFGGEPNYCWVRQAELEIPVGASNRTIMRRLKKAMGLSGVRGRTDTLGDEWRFTPYGMCTVMTARVLY